MVRKKWRIEEPMLVPAQWQGSVEHFYHFLLGYFMPLTLWKERTGSAQFTVRDCGPMNSWLDLLATNAKVRKIQSGSMLQRTLSHRQERRIFWSWDDPSLFRSAELEEFRRIVLDFAGIADAPTSGPPVITVIDRGPSREFYQSEASENFGSAAMARSVPNLGALARELDDLGTVSVVDLAELTPLEQIAAVHQSSILIAQHGAGLSHMLWLRPGSRVIEIKPPLDPTVASIFTNLAAARGLDYASVPQEGEHSPLPEGSLHRAAIALLEAPKGSHVPESSGGVVARIRRSLPRRDSWGRLIGC